MFCITKDHHEPPEKGLMWRPFKITQPFSSLEVNNSQAYNTELKKWIQRSPSHPQGV